MRLKYREFPEARPAASSVTEGTLAAGTNYLVGNEQ
jgi:hypothetical protein